jgi:2Fe-2S ferredoxin
LSAHGRSLEVRRGTSLCKSLLTAGIAIEQACEMVAACSIRHIYVREGGDSLAQPDDEENDQLDHVWGLESQSRVAFCVKLRDADITVEFPRHTRNHARQH